MSRRLRRLPIVLLPLVLLAALAGCGEDSSSSASDGFADVTIEGNFVWFELGDRTGDFAAAADAAGIVVRPFAGEGARVSIGETEANDRLLAVAAGFGAGTVSPGARGGV